MRTGRRDDQSLWGLVLLAAIALAIVGASPANPRQVALAPPVRMTVEVDWSTPPRPAFDKPMAGEIALGAGTILDAVTWPGGSKLRSRPDGSWELGPSNKGRARVRVEAPLTTDLTLSVGGQVVRVPLASLLEGPSRTGSPSPVEVGVERLAWDPIQVDLGGESFDGSSEPGSLVPLSVAFNVLTPESTEVNLRCSLELRPSRGGEPVWRQDWQEVVATNSASPPRHPLTLPSPGPEGTYVLEVKTSWEPLAGPAGSRLGRWVRRRRNPTQTTSATRRMTLAVVTPQGPPPPILSKAEGPGVGVEVDAIDLARSLGHRPLASGRSPMEPSASALGSSSSRAAGWPVPEAALVEAPLRDRLRGWINRNGPEPSTLAPADANGLSWSAVGLRVPHPERPHRLTLTVSGGHPASLSVGLIAGGGQGGVGRGRVVLDACVSGGPVLENGPPLTFSWPVWPDSEGPVLVLVNRNPSSPVTIGSIVLTELVELPSNPGPRGSARSVGLHLANPLALDRFGGGGDPTGLVDSMSQARNLSTYLAHLGASTVILPDGLADRGRRRGLEGQADEDSTGPDRLDLLLRVLARRGCTAWVDLPFDGPLPNLPGPDSPEAAARGLVRVDRRGLVDGPSYQPIHPEVRQAMARKVAETVAIRKTRSNLAGVLVRLGPGSTLPGAPDAGLDDTTYARFLAATFEPGPSLRPGQGSSDPGRFEARARFVEGKGNFPWLAWRAREVAAVYSSLAEAAYRASPGAILAVSTPGLEAGPVGDEARRVDLAGLGPLQAWRGVGLDLSAWPTGEKAPVVFRGVGLSTQDLGHDLATSPELDEQVAARTNRGVLIGVDQSCADVSGTKVGPRLCAGSMAEGAAGDEPMGHALASLEPRRVFLSSSSVSGQEDRIRRFARVFAALPEPSTASTEARLASGVVVRPIRSGSDTYLALANDTPYPILLDVVLNAPHGATVDDLARGIRLDPERVANGLRLVLELAPFGVSSTRIGGLEVWVVSATPYPTQAVLDGMKAHYEDLSTTLDRLNRLHPENPGLGSLKAGLTNGGFEPEAVLLTASRPPAGVPGWELLGGPGDSIELDRDRPRSGRGSLRLDARSGPSSVVSDAFRLEARTALTIRAWLRSDRADAKVRVRIDGQSATRGYARQLDVLARGEWTEIVVRASQLPEGGLDSARVRFELMGPARLWVDDVSVVGDALSESERLNARRDLMAAISAYREKRYADFARLAGSHWARNVASTSGTATVTGDGSGTTRTGDASALPSSRRLR